VVPEPAQEGWNTAKRDHAGGAARHHLAHASSQAVALVARRVVTSQTADGLCGGATRCELRPGRPRDPDEAADQAVHSAKRGIRGRPGRWGDHRRIALLPFSNHAHPSPGPDRVRAGRIGRPL
jgi:hypothetical protein